MHPLALQLNATLEQEGRPVLDMLSALGRAIYFPKEGILSQSAEAGQKAKRFNASIGIATEKGAPMHLSLIQETLSSYAPKDLYPYAPPAGKPELRAAWREKMLKDNPSLNSKSFGTPIVTNALTHGISIISDLFAEAGTPVLTPDKFWENYELTYGVCRGAEMVHFPLYDERRKFNSEGLKTALLAQLAAGKRQAIVLLNFPNNPTGYTPSEAEGNEIVAALKTVADAGLNIVAVADDAYFGLFFEDSLRESIFGKLANVSPNILAVKVDGATKEEYAWGFRIGFITFAHQSAKVLAALEQKVMGIIRATISNCSHPSQTFVLRALQDSRFDAQCAEKYEIMKARATRVKALLDSGKYDSAWDYYPFNSGYFMCLKLKNACAEAVRQRLLNEYQIGVIALGESDLRVAFSCLEVEHLEELYDTLYKAVTEVQAGA
ncbi:Aspartate/methionine/tyrosine aminotransferase [Formivibrio citricus]|uniref:Putative 8-amino-7-oxononanoate synthase n=1 Tax=Formivibrio citricus TaxID=83765 RepID=A0A1I5BVA2_9NEIS|nr:aminotransferase class I/II-fold pyridoxal phosphate-dependent enzyme [Formivibrio citricus]SFN78608.1 Aspartate/methionine/tyrosine aminotransferase [Formivibrio citricus]